MGLGDRVPGGRGGVEAEKGSLTLRPSEALEVEGRS